MKKFLPVFLLVLLIGFFYKAPVYAQTTPNQQIQQGPTAPDGSWVIDPEVTFIGKNAARSGNLLNYTLKNYNWVCVTPQADGSCDNSNNPLTGVWLTTVTYIVVPLLFVVILATAIVIIVTRGRSLTIMRFLPRFVAVILLIFFSFAIIQFFYQFTDVIQGFFLRPPGSTTSCPPTCISNANLLYVQWDYTKFEGLRLVGDKNSESAFITLLLTKLTALTYFVMVGLLFLRRIILWLFIIVSPIFPILLLFYPVRNTAKIWIGEFFRWLLYAPLFAIFLRGLVFLWQPGANGRLNNIPLNFANPAINDAAKEIYPTAVNILLGGPGQFVTLANSVNLTETFALYVVSLLMLWGVIILPWILLQIFLDYAQNMGVGDSAIMKNMMNIVNRQGPPPGAPAPQPPASGGATINLPFAKKFSMPTPPSSPAGIAMEIPVSATSKYTTAYMPSAQVKAQVLSLTNMSLPSMRDIAKYDTSLISRDTSRQKEAITIRDNLVKIGNPASSSSTSDKERYTEIREKLIKESNNGNTLATSILTAANTASKRSSTATTSQIKSMLTQIANPQAASAAGVSSVIDREKLSKMNQSLVQAKKEGNTLATAILAVNEKTPALEIEKLQEKIRTAKEKGEPVATQIASAMEKKDILPVANRVQTVSKEDYQAVKDMWKENYKNLEVPEGMAGTRTEWVKDDIAKIDNIISLLDSKDQDKISKGMEEVSSILPFLLVGGFSQAEIVAYLKAKQDAAKEVVTSLEQDEEDKVSVSVKKTATATNQMSATISDDTDEDESSLSGLTTPSKTIVTPTATSEATNEILKLTNLELPKLTDIVKYEVRSLTKDKTESERLDKIRQVLERLNNPKKLASKQDQQQYDELRERLAEESQNGNATADIILSAVSQLTKTAGQIDATLSDVKTVLLQIVNSGNIADVDDRDYYTRLHEYLESESKQNNTLAQSILNVNDKTKISEIQSIKEQLNSKKDGGDPVATRLTTTVNDFAKVKQLRAVLSQILSPAQPDSQSNNQTYTKMKKLVEEASKKGNGLATSLLSVTEKTSDAALIQLHKKMIEAGEKGDSVANAILARVSEPFAVPSATRLRQTTPQEYKEEMELWQKAYTQYLVPQGFTEDVKGRSEWINSDIADIEQTIGLLESSDAEKRDQGIKKVSSILPFLLLGGFSYDEMNAYLTTKLNAAKQALAEIQRDEDNKVLVNVQNTSVSEHATSAAIPEYSAEDNYSADAPFAKKNIVVPQGGNEILSLINLSLPTIQDIAKYESSSLFKDKSAGSDVEKIHETLEKITNPTIIPVSTEREKYQKLQEKLIQESQKQNPLAASVLSAATLTSQNNINTPTTNQIKNAFNQIINPDSVDSSLDRKRLEELRNMLSKDARDNNNKLAAQILSVNEKTTVAEIEKIREQLRNSQNQASSLASSVIWSINKSIWDSLATKQTKGVLLKIAHPETVSDVSEKEQFTRIHDVLQESQVNKNQLATSILQVADSTPDLKIEEIAQQIDQETKDVVIIDIKNILQKNKIARPSHISLPAVNRIQAVDKADYEAVKNTWIESYKNLEVPQSTGLNRSEWIKADVSKIDKVINDLSSNNQEQINKGMSDVSDILPFLLIGGFSQTEIIEYLKSKKEAGEETLAYLSKEEDEAVELPAKKDEKVNTNKASEEISDEKEEKQ